jgi:hypothetical protein
MPSDRELPGYVRRSPGPWAVIQENNRTARFRHGRHEVVLIVHVDDGLIGAGERADYILAHPRIVDVIVELKGSDTAKAIRQIKTTRPIWLRHELCGQRLGALIVRGQGLHPKESARVERWKREFRKTFEMRLLVESRNRDYEFEEFLLPEAAHE